MISFCQCKCLHCPETRYLQIIFASQRKALFQSLCLRCAWKTTQPETNLLNDLSWPILLLKSCISMHYIKFVVFHYFTFCMCRESGVVLFQSHCSFVIDPSRSFQGDMRSQSETVPDSSAVSSLAKKSFSLFGKQSKLPPRKVDVGDARSNKDFIVDFGLSLNTPLKISLMLHPFQLELSRRDATSQSEKPLFCSTVSVCCFPFPLSTLRLRESDVVELRRTFPARHVPNVTMGRPRLSGNYQQPPFLFGGILDLQLTQV